MARVVNRTFGPAITQRLKQNEAAVRRRIIDVLDVEAKLARRRKEQRQAEPKATRDQARAELIEQLGHRSLADSVNQEGLAWATNDPFVPHPVGTASRHQVLQQLHRVLQPRTYFEIGVRWGDSLALSRTRTIGVDPAFKIRSEIHCDVRTFAQTSDDFFASPTPFDHFGGTPIDLAFIDGMHLSDFALRDFINVEKHCHPGSVILFDDVLPRNQLEAYRIRRTKSWAGDVYKVFDVLRRMRPDLVLVPLNTEPTGTLLVTNLDPSSVVLDEALSTLTDELTSPDPQSVPDEVLTRAVAVDPEMVFASDVWTRVVGLRTSGTATEFAAVWAQLDGLARLGRMNEPDEGAMDHPEVLHDAQTDERSVHA